MQLNGVPNMQPSPAIALDFWNEDEAKQDQMLYTAFCLLESATSNYAAGHFLRGRGVFDWAATSFYYSSLYSVRLVVFLGCGDFPKGHKRIGSMFKNGNVEDEAWLLLLSSKFERDDPVLQHSYFRQNTRRVQFSKNLLMSNLSRNGVNSQALGKTFEFFGKILTEATDLRNASSYESLLVAHQYNHFQVTNQFKKLVNHFEKLSRKAIKHASRIFQEFVDAHPRCEHFCAFLMDEKNREGFYYLEDSLKNKYPSKTVKVALDLLTSLKGMGIKDDAKAGRFHSNIAFRRFDLKRKLMKDFEKRVRDFGKSL